MRQLVAPSSPRIALPPPPQRRATNQHNDGAQQQPPPPTAFLEMASSRAQSTPQTARAQVEKRVSKARGAM